jgi:D-3-phosphoglycerate dehydrogenase
MSTPWKVLASDGLHSEAIKDAQGKSFLSLRVEKALSPHELYEALADLDFLIVRSATKANAELLNKAPHLKGVIRAGVGIDNIDLKSAAELGIWVWNAPTGNYQSAAEHALALLFALSRRIVPASVAGQSGKWVKKDIGESGRQLAGLTLGLFGAGQIGGRVAKMATGIGMKVQICDPYFEASPDRPFAKVDFETLLKTSDAISIHTPLTPETKHVFGKNAFAKMKATAMLVNAARGGIIHEEELLEALEKGTIEGAGLDVFEKEPFEGSFYTKLLAHPRLISTPHLGASTKEAQKAVGLECIHLLERVHHACNEGIAAHWPKALNQPLIPRLRI